MGFLQEKVLCCLMWICVCLKGNYGEHICKAGEMKEHNSGNCIPCLDLQYQSTPNKESFCRTCGTCFEEMGSELISKCTKTANTKCQCRKGFVPKRGSSSCKCDKGSELDDTRKNCRRCPAGYFNTEAGKKCTPWTDCGKQGVKTNGSHQQNVVCHEGPWTSAPAREGKHLSAPVAVPMTPPLTATTPTPPAFPFTTSVSIRTTRPPGHNSGFPGYTIAVPPVLLLILLSPIICKKLIIPFIQNYKKKADTPCRRPVEESGDSSRSSLVKSSLGQP
ncbi:hypothetical protein COCON_G00178730 [Conger conger]|uniref:TNFR-Cys domain-containing protein n=1 Tax=Conger conger TaxID=82655 RepID=A0A9Q1D599_CONCO|nr:tumor necrosis factor receptor superfamily member 9 [Conger conger]KAJ8258861.1 hypothetical protein COCON_G00178730 [Conger conger]